MKIRKKDIEMKDIDEKIRKQDKEAISRMQIPEEEKNKGLAMLKQNYDMYKKIIRETEINLRSKLDKNGNRVYSDEQIKEQVSKLRDAQQDIVEKYDINGGDINDLTSDISTRADIIKNFKVDNSFKKEPVTNRVPETHTYIPNGNDIPQDAAYDIIPLPSNGECYATKMKKACVSYLTAYDENIIVSPNAYKDNAIFDILLKRKVFNNTIDVMDMVDGDREALILFLRIAGFGNEYPITATDNKTGKQFNTIIDLNSLKYKPFTLVGDENGYFDYQLPITKTNIKFKFLTHSDRLKIEELEKIENRSMAKNKLNDIVKTLTFYKDNDAQLNDGQRAKINTAIAEIDNWAFSMQEEENQFSQYTTNVVEYEIVSVEGNEDRDYIHNFVHNMNIKDMTAFIKYINTNEPGIDYNVEIQKPESLGGGSMKVFLQLDQYIFLNTTI